MRAETDPDPGWVAALSNAPLPACRKAIEEASEERRLFRHLAREHAQEGRDSYVEIDAPLELHALVRLLRPTHVVEVGVSSGVSSAYLLNALEKNGVGTLHSVDLPRQAPRPPAGGGPTRISWTLPAGRSSGWAVPFPLRRRWDLRLGDRADVLPLLGEELSRIDLLVYDVPHDDRAVGRELRRLGPRLPAGSVILVDHGPTGGVCGALRRWARSFGGRPVRRAGLGLSGARRVGPPRVRPSAPAPRRAG